MEFLAKVRVKAFATNRKVWRKLPEDWSKTGRRANARVVSREENQSPETVYTVIGKKQMAEGYTDYEGDDVGYIWIHQTSRTVYIVADRLHKRQYALLDDMELIDIG